MSKKSKLVIVIISIILGVIVAWQLVLSKKINSTVNATSNETLAYEVSELFNSNEQLANEVERLNTQVNQLHQTYQDSKQINETLEEKLNNYKIILGQSEIAGPGVSIVLDKKITSTQLIDLINNLKNIGCEAISINGQRLSSTSSITSGIFTPPITINVVGDKDLLYNSLVRSGGIIEQIGFGEVTIVNDLSLPSI